MLNSIFYKNKDKITVAFSTLIISYNFSQFSYIIIEENTIYLNNLLCHNVNKSLN